MAHSNTTHFGPQSKTQRDRILNLLQSRPGQWIPLPEILDLGIAQYSARVFELRREGHNIENRTERAGESRRSWFRLVLGDARPNPPPKPSAAEQPAWEDRPRVTGLPLFDMVRR